MLSVYILYANIYFQLKFEILYMIFLGINTVGLKKCSPTKVYMKSIGTIAYLASLGRNQDDFSEREWKDNPSTFRQ